ncbi:uncharacterized protein PHALS_09174 [Plasmopara halstedii]|uniref:Uncharacterized protein n=1 Tax=Plasmopara halstedii TaxID=4781 RepID=A0A0P1AF45_PLAHL|nr:uncharacterized protein PHALS_09174 [Plasmopara halstedii]CEG39116.1 hypothetical protein PHALS_09174 [Plasmopara halstedii]|eukprot:XP_024575485.1 hypothetical protein PHALS_09174 [Plasmopara halstedii]
MKIVWLLTVWAAALVCVNGAEHLHFVTEESLEEIREDETRKLTSVQLAIASGVLLYDDGAKTWTHDLYQLLISCSHGTLKLDRNVEKDLNDTTIFLPDLVGDSSQKRSIRVVTTAYEAQQILTSIIYQPDLNYHRTWLGATNPLCQTENDGHEKVQMQLIPFQNDAFNSLVDTCSSDLFPESKSALNAGSIHTKKISVASVNDPPTIERKSGHDLDLRAGSACIGLSEFTLNDAEATAFVNDPMAVIPLFTLQLDVTNGTLEANRQIALEHGIYFIENDTIPRITWRFSDISASSLILKGAISDLNMFLPLVEYCFSPEISIPVPVSLQVTLSDNGFCGDVGKEPLSASLIVPIRILPAYDLGKFNLLETSITLKNHIAPVPLEYKRGIVDKVDCTLELNNGDGMLIGIDLGTNILYRKPNVISSDAINTYQNVSVPTSGLIIRFFDEQSNGEAITFRLSRYVCSLKGKCHQQTSALLHEESSNQEIIEAFQAITSTIESVSDLQIIRYTKSRFWLFWNIAQTFLQEVAATAHSSVSVQVVKRRFHLQGEAEVIETQLKTLSVYFLMNGVWSHNGLNVTLSASSDSDIYSPDKLSTQLDIIATPVWEDIQLLHPPEVALRESSEIALETTKILYPATYISSVALKLKVQSAFGLVGWDKRLRGSAIATRQISEHEFELRGTLVELTAALPNIRIDESEVQNNFSAFMKNYENQTYELRATELTKTNSLQTISILSTEGLVTGDFVLGLDLPARSFSHLDLNLTKGFCISTTIGANDDVETVSQKIAQMNCVAVAANPSDRVSRHEIQFIRVNAMFPAQVHDLIGSFRISFRGILSGIIPLSSTAEEIKITILALVLDVQGVEVSRIELPEENGFQWQITFGTVGSVDDLISVIYNETSLYCKISAGVMQKGWRTADLKLNVLYPALSQLFYCAKVSSMGSLALELSFPNEFNDVPDFSVYSSTLTSVQTSQLLNATVIKSTKHYITSEPNFFRLLIQNKMTIPLASCATASRIEHAIQNLQIHKLRVSVQRKASAFLANRCDYTVVMSAPTRLTLSLVADSTLFKAILINRGSKIKIALDTISMYLGNLDDSKLFSSGKLHVSIPRMAKKLGIQLSDTNQQVEMNQTMTVGIIDVQGYADELNFTASCTKGNLHLQAKHALPFFPVDKFVDSMLTISGSFSDLKRLLQVSQIVYTPFSYAVGFDKINFSVVSYDDRAIEFLPIKIILRLRSPILHLPESPVSVFESEFFPVTGLRLDSANIENDYVRPHFAIVRISSQSGLVEIVHDRHDHDSSYNSNIQLQGDAEDINGVLKLLSYRYPAVGDLIEDHLLFTSFWADEVGDKLSPVAYSTISVMINTRPLTVQVLFNRKAVGSDLLITTTMNKSATLKDLSLQVDGGATHLRHCNESPVGVAEFKTSMCNFTLRLSLFTEHGYFSNHSEPFLHKNQETSLASVQFLGSVAEANSFLRQQSYAPDPNYYGFDQVVLVVEYTIQNGSVVDSTETLPVFVAPICEAPQLLWADTGTNLNSQTCFTFATFFLPEILLVREGLKEGYCHDNEMFRMIVQADTSALTIKSRLVTGLNNDQHHQCCAVELAGNIRELTSALRSVEIQFEMTQVTSILESASVEVRLERESASYNDLAIVLTSATLQLRFVDNFWSSNMLMRESIESTEDTDVLIGSEINLDWFTYLSNNDIVNISVQNGVVYAKADISFFEASNNLQIECSNKRFLRSVMSNLHYIPDLNFNGIDEILFKARNREFILYIHLQAENDRPELAFDQNELKNWFNFFRKLIPTIHLEDPDNHFLEFDIHIDNGSLILDESLPHALDGVSIKSGSSKSSLRLSSSLATLNVFFHQRIIEVIPNDCSIEGLRRVFCSMSIKACANDGTINTCQQLYLPQQEHVYQIIVSDRNGTISVSAGEIVDLYDVFTIHQNSDATFSNLILRVNVSSGSIKVGIPTCADSPPLKKLHWSSLIRTQSVHALNTDCLNDALATLQLQSVYNSNDPILIQLELLNDFMQLLANESVIVKVTPKVSSKKFISVKAVNDKPWLPKLGVYVHLSSLVDVSIVADRVRSVRADSSTELVQLEVSCLTCAWKYETFVPRVSYEFAQTPSCKLKLIGPSDALNRVLKTLELTVTASSTFNAEAYFFEVTPASSDILTEEQFWRENANISISYVSEPSRIWWEARQNLVLLQSPEYTANLNGVKLKGFEEFPFLNLTITLYCTHGEATIFIPRVRSTMTGIPCGSSKPAVTLTVEQSEVNLLLSSTVIRATRDARERRFELQITAVKSAQKSFSNETSIKLQFRTVLQPSVFSPEPQNVTLDIQVDGDKVQPIGDLVALGGEMVDTLWFRLNVRITNGQLFVPSAVCCVNILDTNSNNEVDMIGKPSALKLALSLLQVQSINVFRVVNTLKVTISPHTLYNVADFMRSPSKYYPMLRPVNVSKNLQPFRKRLDIPSSYPLANYEDSWNVLDNHISDDFGQLVVRDDYRDQNLLNTRAIDTFFAPVWQLAEMTHRTFIAGAVEKSFSRITAIEKELRNECSRCVNAQISSSQQIRNHVKPAFVLSQQTLDQLDDVPIPRVNVRASLNYATEDSAFQFPDLALQFLDSASARYTFSSADEQNQLQAWNLTSHHAFPRSVNPRSYMADNRLYTLDIRVSCGAIYLICSGSLHGHEALSGAQHLKLEGTVTELNRNLSCLVYFTAKKCNEEQYPGGHIVDWKFAVSFRNNSVESFADLVIMSKANTPKILISHAFADSSCSMDDFLSFIKTECLPLECDEDSPVKLGGFQVQSGGTVHQASSERLNTIKITVSQGVLSLGDNLRSTCMNRFEGVQASKQISFTANVDCVNKMLARIVYVGEPDFSGTDQLKIHLSNHDEIFDEVIVPIIVHEINDAPYIAVDSSYYEADEDVSLVIDGFHLRDPDALNNSLRVILETKYGQLALLRQNGVQVTAEAKESVGKVAFRLTLEGTLRNLDTAITSVIYTSAKDWNSLQYLPDGGKLDLNGFDMITINSSDSSSFNGSSLSVIYVYVNPKPDPVLINVPYAESRPGILRGDEDTWIEVKGLAFSSADDTSQVTLLVSISVTQGILSLLQVRGLTFFEQTTDYKTLKIKGTFACINACINALRYLPDKDFFGQDSLGVTAVAIDEYTQQQTPSSFISVVILVSAINDAPVWNIGSSTTRKIYRNQAISISGISFHDVDIDNMNCTIESCELDLQIEASDGFVVVSDQSNFRSQNQSKTTYIVLSGTTHELNTLLSRATFELATAQYKRAGGSIDAKLRLTVDDRGASGYGGPQISTTTILFNLLSWSHSEYLLVAPDHVLTLKEDTAIVFNGNLRLDNPGSSRSYFELLELTITSNNGHFALESTRIGVQILQNDSDGKVVLRGSFTQLNAALNGSSYIPRVNRYGSDELSLSLLENALVEGPKKKIDLSIYLYVTPVCDEPYWEARTDFPLIMKEDGYLPINSTFLVNPDRDDDRQVEVTIRVAHGGVMLSVTEGLLIQHTLFSTSEEQLVALHAPPGDTFFKSRFFYKELIFRGQVGDINAALKEMVFNPWLDYNSDGWPMDEIVLEATSFCGNLKETTANRMTIPIAVLAVNDPPKLISHHFELIGALDSLDTTSWQSPILASEGISQRIESSEIYDPDDDVGRNLRLLVNISCYHCSISRELLTQRTEIDSDDLIVVTQNSSNVDGIQLIVHGKVASLNIGVMSRLVLRRMDNYNGLAFVVVEISDLGNFGEGGSLSATYVLCVEVNPKSDISRAQTLSPADIVDDTGTIDLENEFLSNMQAERLSINAPPTISMASTFYVPMNNWVSLSGIEIFDRDSGNGLIYVSIAVHNGKLRVLVSPGGPTQLSLLDFSQELNFATTLMQAKQIFVTLEYMCDDSTGCSSLLHDYLTVHVDDNGYTGTQGPKIATKRAEVVVIGEV